MRVKITKLFYEPEPHNQDWDNRELCEWIIGQEFEAEKLIETHNWDYLACTDMLDDVDKLYVIKFDKEQEKFINSFFVWDKFDKFSMTFTYWPEDCLEILQ